MASALAGSLVIALGACGGDAGERPLPSDGDTSAEGAPDTMTSLTVHFEADEAAAERGDTIVRLLSTPAGRAGEAATEMLDLEPSDPATMTLHAEPFLDGDHFITAEMIVEEAIEHYSVLVTLTGPGEERLDSATTANVGRTLAVVSGGEVIYTMDVQTPIRSTCQGPDCPSMRIPVLTSPDRDQALALEQRINR